MNLQIEMMTDNNEMNPDKEVHCCHCHEGECCCQEESEKCGCYCRQHEIPCPKLPCLEMDPDNFNDWD